jgi:D-alanyl-D-alanine carboxypeptidase
LTLDKNRSFSYAVFVSLYKNFGKILEEGTIAIYPDKELNVPASVPRRVPGSGIIRQSPQAAIQQSIQKTKESIATDVTPVLQKAKQQVKRDFSKPSFTPEVPKQWRHFSIIALAALVATIGVDNTRLPSSKANVTTASAATEAAPINHNLANNDVLLPSINSINLPPVPVKNEGVKDPYIAAAHVYVMDDDTKMPLYEKDADTQIDVASTTKTMTALLVAQNYTNLDERVTLTPDAINQIGSGVGYHPGETATVRQMLYGLMLVSGNDAAKQFSEMITPEGGQASTAVWVDKMNQLAQQLGMTHSHFADPAGLDDQNGHSTAADMAKAFSALMQNPLLAQVVGTANYEYTSPEGYKHTFKNSNRLITDEMPYDGMEGGKTGFTPKVDDQTGAGHCLIVSAKRNGHRVIATVYDTYSNEAAASAMVARDVLNYAFNSYT